MAGKQTSLLTGSNCKVTFDGITLAFATDIQYDVSVQTIPVEVMGKFEVVANEPVAYVVAGSFSVVRYTAAAKLGNITGAAANGNGLGAVLGGANGAAFNSQASGGGNSVQIDPGQLLLSKTVDISIFRKKINNPTQSAEQEVYMTIKDARITRMSGSVNKRSVAMESFQFVAEIAYGDSFTASGSGETDLE